MAKNTSDQLTPGSFLFHFYSSTSTFKVIYNPTDKFKWPGSSQTFFVLVHGNNDTIQVAPGYTSKSVRRRTRFATPCGLAFDRMFPFKKVYYNTF
jgi:hypothetical protein